MVTNFLFFHPFLDYSFYPGLMLLKEVGDQTCFFFFFIDWVGAMWKKSSYVTFKCFLGIQT